MKLKNFSILVIDDDTDVLTAVRLLLKNQVIEVVTEKNPEKIPELLASKKFDLVLLDMNFNSSINTGNEGFFPSSLPIRLPKLSTCVFIPASCIHDAASSNPCFSNGVIVGLQVPVSAILPISLMASKCCCRRLGFHF